MKRIQSSRLWLAALALGIAFGAHAKGPDPAYGKQQDATISQVKGTPRGSFRLER